MAATITQIEKYYRGGTEYGSIKVTVPTADVLTLNGTPITLVAAPGAGKMIIALRASGGFATYAGVQYTTNLQLNIETSGAGLTQLQSTSGIIDSTVSGRYTNFFLQASTSPTTTHLIANTALVLKVETGNPAAGTSNLVVYLDYKIITL